MRCPECNKFAAYEEQDPEVDDLEIDGEGHVTATIRIVNVHDECGTELTEATLELDETLNLPDAKKHTCDGFTEDDADQDRYVVEETGLERTSRSEGTVPRYSKTFYGAKLDYEVKCAGCGDTLYSGSFEEDIQASHMDGLV